MKVSNTHKLNPAERFFYASHLSRQWRSISDTDEIHLDGACIGLESNTNLSGDFFKGIKRRSIHH